MSTVNVKVVPAAYEVTLKLNQEQVDWLWSFCGEINGTYTSPLRQVTDEIYDQLKKYKPRKVDITKEHWVIHRMEMYND